MANGQHFAQLVVNGGFRLYQYPTKAENLQKYGTDYPPSYNLSLIDVPMYFYSSDNDWLGDQKDLEGFLIPNLKKGVIKVREKL